MDIDDVPSLFSNNKDKKVLEQIQKFLEKNNADLQIGLRHNHFRLHPDEMLVMQDGITTPWLSVNDTKATVAPARYARFEGKDVPVLWDVEPRMEVDPSIISGVLNIIEENGMQDRFEVVLNRVSQPKLEDDQVLLEQVFSTQRKTVLAPGSIPKWEQKWTTYSFKDGVLATCCKSCASDAHSRTTH